MHTENTTPQLVFYSGKSRFTGSPLVEIRLADQSSAATLQWAERVASGNRCTSIAGVKSPTFRAPYASEVMDAAKHLALRWEDWAQRYDVKVQINPVIRHTTDLL